MTLPFKPGPFTLLAIVGGVLWLASQPEPQKARARRGSRRNRRSSR